MPIELCEQRRRILATAGPLLVRGGAGSGKTTIALAKASEDLAQGRLGKEGVALFLSFARATVARVAEHATATIDASTRRRIEINTYHGFAWNVLRSHGYLLCRQPGISLLLPAQARARLAGLTGVARTARQRALFDEEGLVSFDLFPTLLCELFACAPQLAQAYARSYPLIIVDEFQDTNADEWAMIRTLGRLSSVIALGDPKQRIYDFKGADPRRFDEFIAEFRPAVFDFAGENRRSAGTGITGFADAMIAGNFRPEPYAGVTIGTYAGQGMRPLKQSVLQAAARLRRTREWSVAVLVPANVLAVGVFDYMRQAIHGLPAYPVDILVASEGPALAGHLVGMLLEPCAEDLGAAVMEALAAFELGRSEHASQAAITSADRYNRLAIRIRAEGAAALQSTVVGRAVSALVEQRRALELSGDPVADWRAVRALLDQSGRAEIQAVGKDARHMRLLRRGAQIEARFADAWRQNGCYHDARTLLAAALVEDQFAATTRPNMGVTVMTIHKAKGKEFDEVIVFESPFQRFLQREDDEGRRSARFNLHVAATRARLQVHFMTPATARSPLLP